MSDDLVKRICQDWVKAGCSDDCFWEGWPECPTPEDSLTPRMVIDRIEELETKLATARPDALEEAAEVCTNIIRDYDVMKPNGTTYEPVHVQRAAKGMVSLARADIRALIAKEEPTT
jgi:hypothetical protein